MQSVLATLISFILLTPALATTAPTSPAPGAGTAPATGGGLADWWWVIVVLVAAAAIWYFTKGRRSP
jgi:uncharacterized protein HemX